ncbi:MAG: bifunctional hydroxymethylpyrimidine kinase/phosphomethylpyrimidine kinase [Candidatus Eremiobacteraeota bacterium]|nr:bifunctional hydroxymethylpyrimidine kinase/phosphomethylpyrimidine kinase [Candidatus Eremiobacteraeota bacterium]
MARMIPIVISIGTTHPWNVAGTGRDLIVGADRGVRVFTAVAAVSAQDAAGVTALDPVPLDVLRAQLATLPWEAAGAVRIGALPTLGAVRAAAAMVRARLALPAVVDPVFAASSGGALADDDARYALRDELATLPNVVLTPNVEEAAELLSSLPIERDTVGEAALALQLRGANAVLIKGGHFDGDPVDALATAAGVELFSEPRIAASMRGTGCTLAMALAAELARGNPLHHAVAAARAYVRAEIARH